MDKMIIDKMIEIVGEDYVIDDLDKKLMYLYDQSEEHTMPKADESSIVVKPKDAMEISLIMKYANDNKINVVVRGGGTGLVGACVPTQKSIIVSMERLNKIIEIDKNNMVAVLEGGVTLFELLEELEKYDGICFPVHPGDEGAQIGGMVATNAGGARAVRHGVMRKHVMGLEVVLANGEILNLGGKLIKNNAGYNLMNLLIGSEGTLGTITKVILKIYSEEKYTATIIAPFEKFDDASHTVIEIINSGIIPLAIEYQDKHLFTDTAEMLGTKWQAEKGNADLMIIISEKTEEMLWESCRRINEICSNNNSYELLYAGKKDEQEELLKIRSQSYECVKHIVGMSFDMAVPVSEVPSFLKELKGLAAFYNTQTNVTAHIADGNIHNDIILVDGKIPSYAEEFKNKMYEACFKRGGTITGEHGIGKVRVKDLLLQKDSIEIELMKNIKRAFDPNNILNKDTVLKMD